MINLLFIRSRMGGQTRKGENRWSKAEMRRERMVKRGKEERMGGQMRKRGENGWSNAVGWHLPLLTQFRPPSAYDHTGEGTGLRSLF